MEYNNKKQFCKVNNGITIIDPNDADNFFNSSNNIPIQNEELNISVQLETISKARTIITTSGADNQNKLTVSFIDANLIDGKKSLTTNYTLLTTEFDKDNENKVDENFGITDINIDFDTAYTPMVTINFVDVRGSAIFQNDGNLSNKKYRVFFDFPYPIYKLTIKGYYGKPVTYCLHMTTFNSKFNSQTGNFEISAKFIGYTYAMLADMIMGYLGTIGYTTVGDDIYKSFSGVEKIDDFVNKIDTFNNLVSGIKSNSPAAKKKKELEDKSLLLNEIEFQIINFGQLSETNVTKTTSVTLNDFNIIVFDNTNQQSTQTSYDSAIEKLKNDFNSSNPNTVKLIQDYRATSVINIDIPINNINDTTIKNIINNKINATNNTTVSYYNFINYIEEIKNIRVEIDKKITELDKEILEDISNLLTNNSFKPTVGYVSKVFVTAIEVFLKSIYRVSQPLENDVVRNDILKGVFNNKQKSNDYGLNNQDKFYPWPAYFEETNQGQFAEKYLGDASNIKNSPNNYEKVGELKFVDELLASIIRRQQNLNRQNLQIINKDENWIPVNPADTRLFITESPYLRIGNNIINELEQLILTRAITFLSYSNRSLTEDQIREMAAAEADLINELQSLQSQAPIISLKNKISNNNLIEEFIFKTSGNITNTKTNVFKRDSSTAKYNYINFSLVFSNLLIIPLKTGFNNYNWDINQLQNEYENNGNIFLTNYSSNKTISTKDKDGGLYLKIFTEDTFNNNNSLKPLRYNLANSNNKITLSKLKNNDFTELNPFGGNYGIQEFNLMDYDDIPVNDVDLMYVFYRDNDFNSLSYYRNITKTGFDTNFDIDVNNNTFNKDLNLITTQSSYNSLTNETPVTDKYKQLIFSKNRLFLTKNITNDISYPFIKIVNNFDNGNFEALGSFSLFGSPFYYSQYDENSAYRKIVNNYSKALLFLSTLPFYDYDKDDGIIKLFPNEILNLFNQKSGFIHAPRLWCALIGGLLWRNDTNSPKINNGKIIEGGSGPIDPINWSELKGLSRIFIEPKRNEYINIIQIDLDYPQTSKFNPITYDFDILQYLPEQVKEEFKKIFFDFVNGTSEYEINWSSLKDKLEIFDEKPLSAFTMTIDVIKNTYPKSIPATDVNSLLTSKYKNLQYYQSFIINNESQSANLNKIGDRKYFIELELKGKYGDNISDEKTPVTLIIDALNEKSIIANNSYRIWPENNPNTLNSTNIYDEINYNLDNFKVYFSEMYDKINIQNQTNTALQTVFGTEDLPAIKLKIYKYCKNIYDKWISGSETENVIYRCGDTKYNTLMESFRFLSRSFEDISEKFYIDTSNIPKNLRDNSNNNFYNFYTNILSDNGFDFIPLPTFINYRDEKALQDVFKTYPDWYNIPINQRNNDNCGPMFICVYGGEKSRALDLGNNSSYPNDGFDFNCDSKNIPNDFNQTSVQNGLAVFKVNYGQQNQNIFTDVQLDQSEFRETDESLKIQESISNNNANIGLTSVGQNLYNIYNVRSYSSKITMLGNPMIQPMMYYQLNNIPMFKGAYLITNITHDIRPNHMTTTFTGQRIKYSTLPLIDKYALISNIVGVQSNNSNITTNTSGGANVTRSVPPIVATIIENGGTDSNIEVGNGNIKFKEIPKINGVGNRVGNVGNKLLSEAVPPLVAMLTEFVNYAKANNYPTINDNYIIITSAYRSYQTQESMYNASFINGKPSGLVAPAGQSNHAWGIAVDFVFIAQKDGNVLKKGKETPIINTPEGFDDKINPSIKWFLENSYRFGFIIPKELRDNKGIDEFWHFEYHGTSAKCFYEKEPTTYGLTVSVDKLYNATVKNPKDKSNVEAKYTSCNYTKANINSGDGTPKNIDTNLIYQELRKQLNYPDEAIAGIMGNMYQESRFIPTATNSSTGAFGLVQWLGPRKNDFNKYISNNNLNENSYVDQIKFIKNELDTTFIYTKNNLIKNTNVDDATKIFSVTYEAGNLGVIGFTQTQVDDIAENDNTFNNRKKFANAFNNMIKKGEFYNLTN
jgi:hypothetical protein